jgi:hypothetical protein
MDPGEGNEGNKPGERTEERGDVTREELYELVWAESMLKVAARFEVSSSYIARVRSVIIAVLSAVIGTMCSCRIVDL